LSVAMVSELFPTPLRSTGLAMTAGLGTALIGGTAPAIDQILVTTLGRDIAPGLYVSVVACLALLALRHWPETAFQPTTSKSCLTGLAANLDQFNAGVPQGVDQAPERGVV